MHRRYGFDVAGAIDADEPNSIEIEFTSPVKAVSFCAGDDSLVITPGDSMPGSPLIRKAMYQWGWDWAPKVPRAEFRRSIRLVGYSTALLRDVHVRQEHKDGQVELKISVEIEHLSHKPDSIPLNKGIPPHSVPLAKGDHRGLSIRAKLTSPIGDEQTIDCPIPHPDAPHSLDLIVEHPMLWWPNGCGDQSLYELEVMLDDGKPSPRFTHHAPRFPYH